jgi:putative intracellular protease/amidase
MRFGRRACRSIWPAFAGARFRSSPFRYPETELRKAGALYEKQGGLLEVLSNHVVVDGRIVTGQNQNAGAEVAHSVMALLVKA